LQAATAALVVSERCLAADATPIIIDAHTHFFDPTRPQGVPWPGKDNKLLYRPILPADFRKVAGPHGVTGTVVVEASPWLEDNQWVLDIAADDPTIVGLVGHLTPGTDEFRDHVARFAKNRLFRGIRINSGPLKKGLTETAYLDDLKRLADHDLALDVNGGPELLPLVAALAEKLPALRIVINHLANVKIDGANLDAAWQRDLKLAAAHANVYCKVSALVEGASRNGRPAPTNLDFYRPTLDATWQAFGNDRLIYGSNWPVSDRAAPYSLVFQIVNDYVQAKGKTVADKFFATNAATAYKWVKRD
jgi:predicted TIM-barrel fold metal-dependent hydrolase